MPAEGNARQRQGLSNQEYFDMDNNILEIHGSRDNNSIHRYLRCHEDLHLYRIPIQCSTVKTKKESSICKYIKNIIFPNFTFKYFFPTSLNYFHFNIFMNVSLILFTKFHYLSLAVTTYTIQRNNTIVIRF